MLRMIYAVLVVLCMLIFFFFFALVFSGDISSLRRDLEDPARPMKSSAFASEEPAPFTPVSLKGASFVVLVISKVIP